MYRKFNSKNNKNMFSKIQLLKDLGQLKEGDVLEYNVETNKYSAVREFEDVVNNRIVTKKQTMSLTPDFIKENKEYFQPVEDAEIIDDRDFKIAQLTQEVNKLKQLLGNKYLWF